MSKKIAKKQKDNEQEIIITKKVYSSWMEHFSNIITDNIFAEITRIKKSNKKL